MVLYHNLTGVEIPMREANAMEYMSTRGKSESMESAAAILQGIAVDGGLLVPVEIPKVDSEFIDELKDMTFLEALMILLNAFLIETRNELVLTEQQIETMFYIFVNKIPCCLRIPRCT